MEQVIKKLWTVIITPIMFSVVVSVIFETNIIPAGVLAHKTLAAFIFTIVMELATLLIVPLALYLFNFKSVKKQLKEQKEKALDKWGTIRLMMLTDAMFLNVLFYYCFMNVAFAYLAIILLISVLLILPTKKRCYNEINK